MGKKKAELTGWGNYPKSIAHLERPEKISQLKVSSEPLISRGLGRSYGDAALNDEGRVILMERLDRLLSFEETTGLLTAEAGTSLEKILDVFVPKGWFLPVTPGTKYTTLGGCIAADVHGKNHHHDGSIANFLEGLIILLPNNTIQFCSKSDNKELFWASLGGLGLTGIVLEVTLRLIPIETAYMKVNHTDTPNLQTLLEKLLDTTIDDQYSVAWIDCLATGKNLGRSVLMTGHHAHLEELPFQTDSPLKVKKKKRVSLPFHFPSFTLNSYLVKAFNKIYYQIQRSKQQTILDYDTYFYPLDIISHWNRLYGKRGFVQYQCVIPFEQSEAALHRILTKLAKSQRGSFLGVLKRFGKGNPGYLSFPTEGFTLALDLPVKDPQLFSLLHELDEEVLQAGGRIYLAKDACLSADVFRKMYPKFPEWQKVKKDIDPENLFQSNLSRRLKMVDET